MPIANDSFSACCFPQTDGPCFGNIRMVAVLRSQCSPEIVGKNDKGNNENYKKGGVFG